MFYKQSVNNIKVVIIPLDGVLLDLNRLRFNYFKRICKKHNYNITKEQFEKSLGNMKTMYQQFPISDNYDSDEINNVIERDLFEYAKLKPDVIKKEGTEELLHFFNQRKIKIAVLSTHKIKDAIRYLQLTKLYHQIDFIIGGDSNLAPLPDPEVLNTTMEQLESKPEETMLIANFPALLAAGNQCLMNIIYLSDLCPASESIIPRVFKVAKNNLEIINVFLFTPYDTMEIYSPILGMSSDMDYDTLNQTYRHLIEEYHNDPQLVELVRDTYHYYLGQIISDNNLPDNLSLFDQEPIINTKQKTDNNINKQNTIFTNKKNLSKENSTLGIDPNEVNQLIDQINKTNEKKKPKHQKKTIIREQEEIENKTMLSKIIDFGYNVIIIAIISFIGLLLYVGFEDFINGPGLQSSIIRGIIDFYLMIALGPFKLIFNGLSSILPVPSYQELITGNQVVSSLAIELLMAIIFNVIIFYLAKYLYNFIKRIGGQDESLSKNTSS